MARRSHPHWISLALALFSLLLLGMALWPTTALDEHIPLVGESLSVVQSSGRQASPPDYVLTLHWPTALRLGGTATARLTLSPLSAQTPILPAGFNRVVIAELQGSGMAVDPEGEIAEPLLPGGLASFDWTIKATSRGAASATMFLRLQLVPQGKGDAVERTVWARPLETHVLSPLGLSQTTEFALGVAALIVSIVLALPWLLGKLAP